jgi:hypothetical protein
MKMFIDLCDPKNTDDTFTLEFHLEDNIVTRRWIDKVQLAQKLGYPIDDPTRFYGFNNKVDEVKKAISLINFAIDEINSYRPLIDRKITTVDDQDTLNYLHHIFEEYHGLLDQQDTEYWHAAPETVRRALANLNIYVHRCESAVNSLPRMVVTYYGLPKVCKLDAKDYDLFTPYTEFGDLYLNYAEIGKTLKDLWHDNDQYIHDDAFRHFEHLGADFGIRFHGTDRIERDREIESIWEYYQKNEEFFKSKGFFYKDPKLTAYSSLVLGRLTYTDEEHIIDNIRSHQHVLSVKFE